jgi:nucleoside-diphosphate-sugar epimerase
MQKCIAAGTSSAIPLLPSVPHTAPIHLTKDRTVTHPDSSSTPETQAAARGKVALFGAAGAIGHSVAAALRAQGRPYRVVGRSEASLRRAFGDDPLAEIVCWDPDVPASVQAAASGIETLIYMVGVDYWKFALHPPLLAKTLAGARAAGVKQFVLIGTVYPYGRPRSTPVREDHPREPHTFKGRMRKEQEDLLMAADAAGHIKATILRLPDFYGPGAGEKSYLASAFQVAAHGGTADMIGPLDRPHEFVFVPDVGPVVTRLMDTPAAYGHAWHLGGAGVTSQAELVREIERQVGHPLKLRVAGKALLRVIGWFKPMVRELVEMHYLMTDPVIMDDRALTTLIGPIRKTPYAEGVRLSLLALQRESASIGAAA